jgi:hypothetical protein
MLESPRGILGAARPDPTPDPQRAARDAAPGGAACRAGFLQLFGTIQTSHCESGSFRERVKLGDTPAKSRFTAEPRTIPASVTFLTHL